MTITDVRPDLTTSAGATLSDRIRPHLPAIAARTVETEKARSAPPENIELLVRAGFARALAPAAVGGDEIDLWDFCDGVRTVTKACPATGWLSGVLMVHPAVIGQYEPSVQQEVWAKGIDTVICSSGSPIMRAKLADGGIVVSGRGRWSSGCQHAEWAMVGAKVPDLSDSQYPERNPRNVLFMVHKDDYTIDDTWYSEAMSGSGSNDLVFDNLFVPRRRIEEVTAMTFGYSRGAGTIDSWINRVPFPLIFSVFFPAIALGCADGMIEEFIKRQRTRKSVMSGAAGILHPAGQMRLAESVHEIESLTAYLRQVLDQIQEFGMTSQRLTEAKFHEMQHKLPFITHRAVGVVQRLFEGAGASAVLSSNPLQRYWRDAHAARLHFGSDYDSSMVMHGRNILGLGMTPDL